MATTESPVDTLDAHRAIAGSGWGGRVITAYRPDAVIDPEHEAFAASLERFGELTGEDVSLVARLPVGASQAPCGVREGGRDVDRSRPSDRGDRGSVEP